MQFTSNEGMSDDAPYVSVNLRWTITPGTASHALYDWMCGFFNLPQNSLSLLQRLWDGAYGLSSLSEN